MGILSNHIELALLKHMFGQTELVIPSGLWLGLHTGSPLEDNSVSNEVSTSGTGYARIKIANDTNRPFQASTSNRAHCDVFSKANTTHVSSDLKWDTVNSFDTGTENLTTHHAIDFAEAQSSWGNISHWSIWNHPSASSSLGTNLVATGALSASVSVGTGDVFRIPAGDFDIAWPSKMGRGAVVNNQLDRVTGFATNYSGFKSEKENATEWRLQLMRRLGFETMPTNWDSTSYAAGLTGTDQSINHAWPNMSLPYLGKSFNQYDTSTTTSSFATVTDQDIYLALYKSDPGNHPDVIATSVEPSTSYGYSRVKVNSSWATASISGGVASITNNSSITFDEATSSWGTITHWGLYRGDDSDNLSNYVNDPTNWEYVNSSGYKGKANCPFLTGALTTSRTVNSGDILRFGSGDFVIKLD